MGVCAQPVFTVGVLTVIYAFLSSKLPNMCRTFTFVIVGLIFYSVTSADKFKLEFINALRLARQGGLTFDNYAHRYLASGLIAYGGFILSVRLGLHSLV
jgi:hypothetical protein